MPKRRKLNSKTVNSLRVLPKRSHICPICSTSIPTSELAAHYTHERNLLSSPQQPAKRPAAVLALSKITDHPRYAKRTESSLLLSRVRTNREARRKNEVTEFHGQLEECPICGLELVGSGTSITEHVESCLDSQSEQQEEPSWDVYEFGGQTRVRAIGLLDGGVRSLPNVVVHTDNDNDGVDVFVDVDGDADAVYGKTQYTEVDLLNPDSIPSTGKPSGNTLNLHLAHCRSSMQHLSECVLYSSHFCTMFSHVL